MTIEDSGQSNAPDPASDGAGQEKSTCCEFHSEVQARCDHVRSMIGYAEDRIDWLAIRMVCQLAMSHGCANRLTAAIDTPQYSFLRDHGVVWMDGEE